MYNGLFINQVLSIAKTEGLFHNPFLVLARLICIPFSFVYRQSIEMRVSSRGMDKTPLISYLVIHVPDYMLFFQIKMHAHSQKI